MNAAGNVIVAGSCDGTMHVSHDSGASWTTGTSASAVCWISETTTASGDTIYAVQYSGNMYRSRDFGASWTQVTGSPLIASSGGIGFESVATSQDGARVATVIQNGPLVMSTDSGATWSARSMGDGLANHWWRWVAMTPSGTNLVAVAHDGVFRSTDGGSTWQKLAVTVNGAAPTDTWYRCAMSSDGRTIAIVGNTFGGAVGTGIYVSHDGGATWARPYAVTGDYTYLAMSSDGTTIAGAMTTTGSNAGRMVLSRDGGASFTVQAMPGNDNTWRAVAMSSNASLLAAATGNFLTHGTGLLYLGR